MKLLFVTNMFPVPDYIYFGIHVKEQIDNLVSSYNYSSDTIFINGRLSKLNYVKSFFLLPAFIKKNNPDIIHIHYGISGMFLLLFKPKMPVVITLHSGEIYRKKSALNHFFQKNITFRILHRVDKIIILNDDMQSKLNMFSDKLIKIPCGIDTSFFCPNDRLKNYKNKEKLVIGFPGNKARPEKNFSLFSKIINELERDLNINIEVIEFNNMTRKQVVDNLNKLDLLCMTSLIEGSPQIIKEAMACNIPIVSSDAGDVKYLLEGVDNCYVISSFESKDYIQYIKAIANLPVESRISNGRIKIESLGLSLTSVSGKLEHLYKTLKK